MAPDKEVWLWAKLCCPKFLRWSPNPHCPSECDVFEENVLKGVIKVKRDHWGQTSSNVTVSL